MTYQDGDAVVPTEAGWYFVRWKSNASFWTVEFDGEDVLSGGDLFDDIPVKDFMVQKLWAGPIPQPSES